MFAIHGPRSNLRQDRLPPPDTTVGGSVTGLEGDGLVLQNNGADDEPIDADGDFTFDTPVTPGTNYSVTVKTQPSNPAQKCTVARGWGTVPADGVDDVLVTCTDVPVEPPCECDLNTDGRCDGPDWLLFFPDWGQTACNESDVDRANAI